MYISNVRNLYLNFTHEQFQIRTNFLRLVMDQHVLTINKFVGFPIIVYKISLIYIFELNFELLKNWINFLRVEFDGEIEQNTQNSFWDPEMSEWWIGPKTKLKFTLNEKY